MMDSFQKNLRCFDISRDTRSSSLITKISFQPRVEKQLKMLMQSMEFNVPRNVL